jgi:DNA-binding CsgD family transcriptional regulator
MLKSGFPITGGFDVSNDPIAAMIDLVGTDQFFSRLADLLEKRMGYKQFHIFLYRHTLAPAALASRPEPVTYARGLNNYLQYTYVINPAFRAFQQGIPSGVYLISDFIKKEEPNVMDGMDFDVHIEDSEAIGYRTPGWPKNMAEVIVLINLPNGTSLDFSFLTMLGSQEARDCQRSLDHLYPFLNSVLLRQFAIKPDSFDAMEMESGLEDRFQDFGAETLTAREREITQLIVIGHSSSSIALNLNISVPTVKTHRRNIYRKLQISSQAELFSLFLLHLK